MASFRILMPFWDSSTDFVSDSRAISGLWNPSEFSAVQNSQRMWAFRCWSWAFLMTAGSTPAALAATILSISTDMRNSALRILPLMWAFTESIVYFASSSVHFGWHLAVRQVSFNWTRGDAAKWEVQTFP